MKQIGMPVADHKTIGPTQFPTYLGLLLNLVNMTLQIPEYKRVKNLERIQKLIEVHHSRKQTTVKKIQKLAGSLNFLCAAVPARKVFLRSLYRLTRSPDGKTHPSHHRRILKEVYEDMLIFKTFLQDCGKEEFCSIPFLIKKDVYNHKLQLFANSSGATDKGFGCVFQNQWAYSAWGQTNLVSNDFSPNIALLELFAIVVAVKICFGHLLYHAP